MPENQDFLISTPTISYHLAGTLPFNDSFNEDNCIYDNFLISINYLPSDVYIVTNNYFYVPSL